MSNHRKPKTELETETERWYQILAESGFEDIESANGQIKRWSSQIFERHTLEQQQAKESYYQMAETFLNEYKFKDKVERIIWEYHTNGLSYRDISKILKAAKVLDLGHHQIGRRVVKLEEIMKQRYLPGYAND